MRFRHDAVADFGRAAVGAEFDDRAGELVAEDDRRPVGELVMFDVNVGAANAAHGDIDQDFAGLRFRDRDVAEFDEAFAFLGLNEC